MAEITDVPTYTLNDGSTLPAIGFGTYPLKGSDGVAPSSVPSRSATDCWTRP